MARKQTLKSLLGGNDSRVAVDLNLDEQTFRAPQVSAGNYSVAAPVYSKTNALSQLSDSLERYSGPILKGYANIKEQQSLAMADASELLTTEQLKLLDAGDSSGLTESINNDKRKIDEAQRKKLITFAENPNNYERAYRRVGSRVAGVFVEDYLNNMDKYAEDESFDLYTKAEEIAEQYGLNGLGKEEFSKQINSISESTKARFGELKNAHMIREHKAETITDLSQKFSNSTWSEEAWTDATNAGTVEQNQDILLGLVTNLRETNPAKADRVLELYEEGGIKIGNGGISDEFARALENKIANEDERLDLISKGVEKKRKESIDAAYTTVTNAIAFDNVEMPASVDIKINEGITLTIDTSEVTNEAEFSQAVADAVMAVEEDDKTFSSTLKNEVMGYFRKGIAEGQLKKLTFRTKVGVEAADSELSSIFGAQDPQGNYIYKDVVDATSHNALRREKRAELTAIVDAIDNDPSLDLIQKDSLAKNAVGEFIAKEKELLVTRKAELAEVKLETDRIAATGGDVVPSLMSIFNAYSGAIKEDPAVSLTELENKRKIAREKGAEIDIEREKILNREQTPDELASNMSDAEFEKLKRQEASDYVDDQKDYFKKDLGYDGKINDIFEEGQEAKEVIKSQDVQAKGTEKANVVIKDSGNVGLAYGLTNQNSATIEEARSMYGQSYELNPQTYRAEFTNNHVQDIHSPKGFGNEFKIGMFDSLRLTYITRDLPSNIDTLHEASQYRAIKFQQEGEKYMEPDKGQEIVAEFFSNETMTRVVRDGVAGMTVDELESGNLKGVKFNATSLNQSATTILPFALLNKAFLDSDNLTTQEEQQVRDYADALYDTGMLNDEGKQAVISKMIGLQVNAYTIIGFEFGK